jgi:aminoglycoside phosphotransferase (APT) family kinase protein
LDSLSVSNPALEFALRWADQHAPSTDHLTFIHGDFRLGNLIVNPEGLAAVADWEFAHVGDPAEDLGYPCMRDWRFGVGHLRLGGIGERELFLKAYEHHSKRKVDRSMVDFWEFLGNVRWAVICLAQANRHLSGRELSVELASLGRRSAEMQMEMLRLIRQMGI